MTLFYALHESVLNYKLWAGLFVLGIPGAL